MDNQKKVRQGFTGKVERTQTKGWMGRETKGKDGYQRGVDQRTRKDDRETGWMNGTKQPRKKQEDMEDQQAR